MTVTPSISAILLDTDGVLYHRPRGQRRLVAFLEAHGYTPRDNFVVERAMRAARTDVQSARITREVFYDALLRVHGVSGPELLERGRAALLEDAADIELFPGVGETLERLQAAGYRLGTVSFTAHPAGTKIAWLAQRGLSPGLWTVFLASPDYGHVTTPGGLIARALHQLGVEASSAAYVGHDSEELLQAAALGVATVAFMPDDPTIQTRYSIGSFYGLADLFLGRRT